MNRLDEIRERWEAATPAPWEYEAVSGNVFREFMTDDGHEATGVAHMENVADGVAVAHAPEDAAALLAAVQAVLDLHPEMAFGPGVTICSVCRDSMRRVIVYPCPTVRAVTAALGEGGNSRRTNE